MRFTRQDALFSFFDGHLPEGGIVCQQTRLSKMRCVFRPGGVVATPGCLDQFILAAAPPSRRLTIAGGACLCGGGSLVGRKGGSLFPTLPGRFLRHLSAWSFAVGVCGKQRAGRHAPGPQTDRRTHSRRLTPSLELRVGCSLRPISLTAWDSRGAKLVLGIADERGRRRGLVEQFLTQHLHVWRRFNANANGASLDRHHFEGDVEAGQDDLLMRLASQDQHSKTPFQTVRTNTGRGVSLAFEKSPRDGGEVRPGTKGFRSAPSPKVWLYRTRD